MDELVLRTDKDGLATLTLNRPEKLNALNVALFVELRKHVETLAQERNEVGLVVIRGAGRCFSAGHDLGDIAAGEHPPEPNFQARTIEMLSDLPQPVIALVHGHCYTGALELALAGNMILAAESAKFADTHAKWGLTPVWGLSQRLPRRVGVAKAQEMMVTCHTYSGADALAIGLANWCVPDGEVDQLLDALAAEILSHSWFSHRANKRLLWDTDGMALAEGLAHEVFRGAGRAPDAQERVARFGTRK